MQPRLSGWGIERDADSEMPGDAEAQEAVAAADTAIAKRVAKQQMWDLNSDEEKGANKRRGACSIPTPASQDGLELRDA